MSSNVTELKTRLGEQLRTYLRQAKLRQLDLANKLNISASAVSQIISGHMTPSMKQLERIVEILHLSTQEADALRNDLSRIRNGSPERRSPMNEIIYNHRVRNGYSIAQLAELTGIPEANLKALETQYDLKPNPTEAVRLASVLGCNLGDLWQLTPPGSWSEFRSGGMLCEPGTPYMAYPPGCKTPLMHCATLMRFDPESSSAMDFCWRNMESIIDGAMLGLAAVIASGSELGLPQMCTVTVELKPEAEIHPGMLALGRSEDQLVLGEIVRPGVLLLNNRQEAVCRWIWPMARMKLDCPVINQFSRPDCPFPSGEKSTY